MMRHFLYYCARIWQYLRDDYISIWVAVFYTALLSGVFFLLGGLFHPQKDVRVVAAQLQESQDDVRRFADKITKQDEQISSLRAHNNLHKKTIALLNHQIEDMHAQDISSREKTLFYQQMLSDKSPDEIAVYALEVEPGFAPKQWQLNAILVRTSKNKAFKGAYFFEVLHESTAGVDITRFPAEAQAFSMGFYYEINQTFTLSKDKEIKKIRLTVINEKKDAVASAQLLEPIAPSTDG